MSYFVYDFCKATAAIPALLFLRPRLLYENENAKKRIRGGALIVANHIGLSDPICVMVAVWYRRHHFICTQEFFDNPKLRPFFKSFQCIPIDKANVNFNTFRRVAEYLKAGKLVSMFPEGHIVEQEGEQEIDGFKTGMVLMALQGGVPIIPVYLKKRKKKTDRMVMVIGEPIPVGSGDSRPSMKEIERVAETIKRKEGELRDYANQQ